MRARGLFSLHLVLAAFLVPLILAGSASGATEKVLYNFIATRHGAEPSGPLTADASGNLYGTTDSGGEYAWGTVYKLTPNSSGGWTQSVLYSFKGGVDGSFPTGGVVFDTAGNLFGATQNGGNQTCICGTVFRLAPNSHGGWTKGTIHNFNGNTDGANPGAGLIFDSAGNLYGTTATGLKKSNVFGTVFELTPNSAHNWTEKVLFAFPTDRSGGIGPEALVFDTGGNLYGTAVSGGTQQLGVVFKLTPSSQGAWTESVLYSFAGGADGAWPYSPLIFDSAGNLYGTTEMGGSNNYGTVFELKLNGDGSWTEVVLHSFSGGPGDGAEPQAGLTFDHAGNLYGTTNSGGLSNCSFPIGCGVVFQLAPGSGGQWTESILHAFAGGNDGGNPHSQAALLFDQQGNLYGTTGAGGPGGVGTVFELSPRAGGHWKKSIVYTFRSNDGIGPTGALVMDGSGNFYGTTELGGAYGAGTVFELTPNSKGGWTDRLLYSFTGRTDGWGPTGGLVFDTAGNLYGTTGSGGLSSCYSGQGCGVVFELTPSSGGKWTESVLYTFTDGADGATPYAGLVWNKGNLYGTAFNGGNNTCYGPCGVVFELAPSSGGQWTQTVIYSFTGAADGGNPYSSLMADATGNLYGTTYYTGCDGCLGFYTTAFELSPNGLGAFTQSVIYTFTDYGVPLTGLTQDSAGNLYGTTAYNNGSFDGTVFELKPSGGNWIENILHTFSGGSDGGIPMAGLVFDAAGNLYGTTSAGGNTSCYYDGCGVVYKLTPASGGQWTYSVFYTFNGPPIDGADPHGGVIFDAAGNLYGTAFGGKAGGVAYEVTP